MFSFGNHTSTVRQAGLAFAQPDAPHLGNRFTPIVPEPPRMIADANIMEEQVVDLDGMNISNSTFNDVTFVYGGGAYNLVNAKLTGAVDVKLIGAAANTAQFLTMLGLIGCPAKPQAPQVNPNAPIIHRAKLDKEIKGDFFSPYLGTK